MKRRRKYGDGEAVVAAPAKKKSMLPLVIAGGAVAVWYFFFRSSGSVSSSAGSGGLPLGIAGQAVTAAGDTPSLSMLAPVGADSAARGTTKDGDYVDVVHFYSASAAASYAASQSGAAHNGFAFIFPASMSADRRDTIFSVYSGKFDTGGFKGFAFGDVVFYR